MILSIHFFLYQNNYFISLLISVCITVCITVCIYNPERTATNLRLSNEKRSRKLRAKLHKERRIFSVHLFETFCPARILKVKFGTRRREEKLY